MHLKGLCIGIPKTRNVKSVRLFINYLCALNCMCRKLEERNKKKYAKFGVLFREWKLCTIKLCYCRFFFFVDEG